VLDQDESETPIAAPDVPAAERGTRTITVVLSLIGLAILLSVAFFPALFKSVTSYDDEGSFLVAIRQFLHHGSLYVHTHGSYGPFYFTVAGLLFKLTGHDPTLTSGRFIVLGFTAISGGMFGAAVWRVSRSLPFALLCEVGTFAILVRVAGNEPMHPGTLIVVVLSVLAFAISSYAVTQSTAALVVIGASVGALAMMKINVGIFAAAAIVVALVIGNPRYPKILRVLVGFGGAVLPFLITSQLLYQTNTTILAVLVSVGLMATYASLSVDTIDIPVRSLWITVASAAGCILVSSAWPLATGTTPASLFHGVVIQPLMQAENLQRQHGVHFDQLSFVLAALAVCAVLARKYSPNTISWARSWQLDAAFGISALLLFGLGVYGGFGAWLPGIAVLPALALLSDAPPHIRLVLRFLVPLSILQFLHAYPVAGSQVAWSRVVMCVPCAVVMAAAVDRLPGWREVGPAVRGFAITAVAMLTVALAGFVPLTQWRNYERHIPLGLPGAALVRVTAHEGVVLRKLTRTVQHNCDTFYSAPAFNSLYLYTKLPNPTGMLADTPGALNAKEQREIASALRERHSKGERVCIVRDSERTDRWLDSSYGDGPLGDSLAHYTKKIAHIGQYTVSVYNAVGADKKK
jgi:hypothetical protein